MKKVTFILITLCVFSLLSDPLKKERKMIKEDKKFISQLEKELSVDEKGCDNPSKDLDFSVFMELKIYCNSRSAIKNRLPQIKSQIINYENYLNNYWKNCKVATTKTKIDLCSSMNTKLKKKAGKINVEREQLESDMLVMKTAGEQAKKLYERKSLKQEREEKKMIRDTLKIKKETVKLMRGTINDDGLIFKRSLAQVNMMHHQNNPKLKNAIQSMKKILKFLIKCNSELLTISLSLTRKIDDTYSQCTIKHSDIGCTNSEKKMIEAFKTANSKFNIYSQNRNEAAKLEIQLHKIAINTVKMRMQDARNRINSYIGSLESQNSNLKKQIEMSKTDMGTIKNTGNKQHIAIYKKLVNKMTELEKNSGEYLKDFKDENTDIENYVSECTEGSLNFSSECSKKGNKIIADVEKTMKKVVSYANQFNRLNRDLNDFAKKVSGK